MSAPKWAVGMRRIAPGVYVDSRNALHVDAFAICESLGCPPTPQNLETAAQAALDAIKAWNPAVKVSHSIE
jgi:hypothetical protein